MPDLQPKVRTSPCTAAERYKLEVSVGILSEAGQTHGRVQDISVSGARIEGVGTQPPEGSELRLGFSFSARALPVPIRGRVVRHTESGGFAVRFEGLDFRTQILLSALLPSVGDEYRLDCAKLSSSGHLEADLTPALYEACTKLAALRGVSVEHWAIEALERAALDGLEEIKPGSSDD